MPRANSYFHIEEEKALDLSINNKNLKLGIGNAIKILDLGSMKN